MADEATIRSARWALGFIFFVNGAIFASWATRIPAVSSNLDLSPGALGVALFFMASGTPVAMPVCGALVSRYGSRSVIRVVLIIACSALLLPALATNVWTLAAALATLGASIGSLVVSQNAQGVAIEQQLERPVLNTFHGLLSLGWLAGALGGAGAARASLPPLMHFATVGVVLLVVGLLATSFLLDDNTDHEQAGATFAKPSKGLAILAIISFCCLFAEGSVLDWSALYLSDSLGARGSVAALGAAAFAITQTGGRFFGNRLVERFGPGTLVRSAAALGTLGILLTVASSNPWIGIAGFGLLGAGLSVIFPVLLSVAGADNAESAGPQEVAAVATAGYVGLLAGPGVIGGAAELLELRYALVVVVVLVGIIPIIAGFGKLGKASAEVRPDGKD